MSKVLVVLRNEFITTVARSSFLFTVLGVPLISALIIGGMALLKGSPPSAPADLINGAAAAQGSGDPRPEGYVDHSGLIRALPASIPLGALVSLPNEAAAQQALQAGEIRAYYVIPADYLASGRILSVRPDFNPLTAFEDPSWMTQAIEVNLLGGDEQLANYVRQPIDLELAAAAPSPQAEDENPLMMFVPFVMTMIFYFAILMSSNLMLHSLSKEKENRVIEVLMMSVTPRQLLAGKVIALGLVGLLQTVLWTGTSTALLRLSGKTLSIPATLQIPPSLLAWGIVFFILGYAVYASLVASIGALVPNLREASQAAFVVIMPMMIPLMLASILIKDPNGALATGLSLFPLTAPVVIMTRLATTHVPIRELLVSGGGLALTAILILRAVAGMFRSQTLLSGQPFGLKRLALALAGRA